jgi:uncharacterized surface protein with fasciclin (FAS1) repeats
MRNRRHRSAWALAIATVLVGGALGLSACGGSDEGAAGVQATTTQAQAAEEMNVVETAAAAGQFTTLASLLQQAGLVDELSDGGPYTVFAPTDEAFAQVPKETLDGLAADPEKLKSVLLYHVVEGSVPSSEVVNVDSAETLNGQAVSIDVRDGQVYVDDAKVTTPDVMASNGVIHVVDQVLIPS